MTFSSLPRGGRATHPKLGVDFLRLPRLEPGLPGTPAFQSMIATEGHFVAPIGDARVSAVDVGDIAAVATALTESGHEGKTYTITGPVAGARTPRWQAPSPRRLAARRRLYRRAVRRVCRCAESRRRASVASGRPSQDDAHYARGEAETISRMFAK